MIIRRCTRLTIFELQAPCSASKLDSACIGFLHRGHLYRGFKATRSQATIIIQKKDLIPPAALEATGREWQGDFKCAMISAAFNAPPPPLCALFLCEARKPGCRKAEPGPAKTSAPMLPGHPGGRSKKGAGASRRHRVRQYRVGFAREMQTLTGMT